MYEDRFKLVGKIKWVKKDRLILDRYAPEPVRYVNDLNELERTLVERPVATAPNDQSLLPTPDDESLPPTPPPRIDSLGAFSNQPPAYSEIGAPEASVSPASSPVETETPQKTPLAQHSPVVQNRRWFFPKKSFIKKILWICTGIVFFYLILFAVGVYKNYYEEKDKCDKKQKALLSKIWGSSGCQFSAHIYEVILIL